MSQWDLLAASASLRHTAKGAIAFGTSEADRVYGIEAANPGT